MGRKRYQAEQIISKLMRSGSSFSECGIWYHAIFLYPY